MLIGAARLRNEAECRGYWLQGFIRLDCGRDPGSVTTIKSREKYLSNRSFKTCGEGLSDCYMVALAAHV